MFSCLQRANYYRSSCFGKTFFCSRVELYTQCPREDLQTCNIMCSVLEHNITRVDTRTIDFFFIHNSQRFNPF